MRRWAGSGGGARLGGRGVGQSQAGWAGSEGEIRLGGQGEAEPVRVGGERGGARLGGRGREGGIRLGGRGEAEPVRVGGERGGARLGGREVEAEPGWVQGRPHPPLGHAAPCRSCPLPAKADARDAAENEAADAGPVTPPQPHVP